MDALVLIPIGALVLVASLRFERAAGRGGLCGLAVGVVVFLFLGVRSMVPDEAVFFASEVSRRVRGQIEEFRRAESRDFFVVEGSSVAAHGCDPAVLRKDLARRGVETGVLQFSAQGANHFERAFFLEAFWRGLSGEEREQLREGHVVLLREVFDAYDRDPLYLFLKESYTERAKVYMSPEYAWVAWQAFLAGTPEGMPRAERWGRELKMAGGIVARVLLNRFGAGALSGMDWRARKRRVGAFFALEGEKRNFDYAAAVAGKVDWKEDWMGEMELPRGWIVGRTFLQKRVDGWVDGEVFFAMPCVEGHRRDYQLAFKKALAGKMVGPPTQKEMEELLEKGFWFDGVHPTGAGAKMFSSWLMRSLLDSGRLKQ